jgi:uncharacterized protein (DUF1330 family)
MPKGYWIAQIDVTDPEHYQGYRVAAKLALKKYGGRFLVRGGECVASEGAMRSRQIIIEFPSIEQAKLCFDSPEYAAAKAIRMKSAASDFAVVTGYDGEQPDGNT